MCWFVLIMKERFLSYLRVIDWNALWDSVSSIVDKVLDPSRDRSARLQTLAEALAEDNSKKTSRAEQAIGVALQVTVAVGGWTVLIPSAALDWWRMRAHAQ